MLCEPSQRLRNAIITGNLLTVKRLLRRFPDLLIDVDPENGWSCLHYASYHGRYLICVYLLQLSHAKHETNRTFKGDTCVHLALMNGHEQTTHLLLQHFPNFINQCGEHGRTPVHVACISDYDQCLSLLMGSGADLTLADNNGETALHICLEYGSLQCMRILLRDGKLINDDLKDKYSWKPSEVAITFDFGKLYNRLRKNIKETSDNIKKPSYASFKTPVLDSKAAFDAGPSPVLTMNSPYTSYSLNSNLPPLPTISTSRKPSSTALAKQSFTPLTSISRKLSKSSSSSSLNSDLTSSSKIEELNNIVEKRTSTSSSIPALSIRTYSDSVTSTPSYIINDNTIQKNKKILNNLGEESNSRHEFNFISWNKHKDNNSSEMLSPTEHLSPIVRNKTSLLSIPFARLRNSSSHTVSASTSSANIQKTKTKT